MGRNNRSAEADPTKGQRRQRCLNPLLPVDNRALYRMSYDGLMEDLQLSKNALLWHGFPTRVRTARFTEAVNTGYKPVPPPIGGWRIRTSVTPFERHPH